MLMSLKNTLVWQVCGMNTHYWLSLLTHRLLSASYTIFLIWDTRYTGCVCLHFCHSFPAISPLKTTHWLQFLILSYHVFSLRHSHWLPLILHCFPVICFQSVSTLPWHSFLIPSMPFLSSQTLAATHSLFFPAISFLSNTLAISHSSFYPAVSFTSLWLLLIPHSFPVISFLSDTQLAVSYSSIFLVTSHT